MSQPARLDPWTGPRLSDSTARADRISHGRPLDPAPRPASRRPRRGWWRRGRRASLAPALLIVLIVLGACAPAAAAGPTPLPKSLPTRVTRSGETPRPSPSPSPSPVTTPTATPKRVFSQRDFDPYADWYATEREGLYVTTRDPRGRYYYRWDDRRWATLSDRVWFRTTQELLTVFPGREPAP